MIEHIVYHPYPCTVRERLQIPSQEQHNSITAVQISGRLVLAVMCLEGLMVYMYKATYSRNSNKPKRDFAECCNSVDLNITCH